MDPPLQVPEISIVDELRTKGLARQRRHNAQRVSMPNLITLVTV